MGDSLRFLGFAHDDIGLRRFAVCVVCLAVSGVLVVAHAVWRQATGYAVLIGFAWLIGVGLALAYLDHITPEPLRPWHPPSCRAYSGGNNNCPGG